MSSDRELREAVDALTRDVKHATRDADGRLRFITVSPLLVQLRLAITNSTAAGSYGNGGGGASIPVGAAALDLFTDITETVHVYWWRTYQHHHGHGRGKVALELRTWASVAYGDPEALAECLGLCSGWVRSINGLLQPVRRWEIQGVCPKCKSSRVLISEDDGKVWGPALSLCITESETWAECLNCSTKFVPETLASELSSE